MDANFCAQFIQIMHSQGTPGFHTLGCYDKVRLFHGGTNMSFNFSSSLEIMSKLYCSLAVNTRPEIMVWTPLDGHLSLCLIP